MCKQFNILPNNPALAQLTDNQRLWCADNMRLDAEKLTDTYSEGNLEQTFGITDQEFTQFSKDMKEVARQQAAEAKVQREKAEEDRKKKVNTLKPREAFRAGDTDG